MDSLDETIPARMVFNRGRVYDCGRVPPLTNNKQANSFSLLSFLTTSHTNQRRRAFSESGWKRRIERGQISVDGTLVRNPRFVLSRAKQHIHYHRPPWKEPILVVTMATDENSPNKDKDEDNNNSETNLVILYLDDHLMVVHKPSGLPTMPSQTYFEYSILNAVRRLHGSKSILETPNEQQEQPETNVIATDRVRQLIRSHCSAPPQPVHRLGVGTSGVLVLATSLRGRKSLTDAIKFKSHNNGHDATIRKVYRALVYAFRCDQRSDGNNTAVKRKGTLIPDAFTIDCPIGLVPFPIGGDTIHAACPLNERSLYDHVHTQGHVQTIILSPRVMHTKSTTKPALSHVRVLCRHINGNKDTALVEVEILTGRPHQIRIHMAYAGYPLVGDPLYLSGGIPDTTPKTFPSREREEEDMDSDSDEDKIQVEQKELPSLAVKPKTTTLQRVALPRDCGYHLHAHRITLEHPCDRTAAKNDQDGCDTYQAETLMTFTAPPPPLLREG